MWETLCDLSGLHPWHLMFTNVQCIFSPPSTASDWFRDRRAFSWSTTSFNIARLNDVQSPGPRPAPPPQWISLPCTQSNFSWFPNFLLHVGLPRRDTRSSSKNYLVGQGFHSIPYRMLHIQIISFAHIQIFIQTLKKWFKYGSIPTSLQLSCLLIIESNYSSDTCLSFLGKICKLS